MKVYGGEDVWIHMFWTSELVGGEWSASHPSRFIAGEIASRYPLAKKLGGPQSQSGRLGEEKILDSTKTRTPTPQSCSP